MDPDVPLGDYLLQIYNSNRKKQYWASKLIIAKYQILFYTVSIFATSEFQIPYLVQTVCLKIIKLGQPWMQAL